MPIQKNRLYLLLAAGCVAGYSWLFFNYQGGLANSRVLKACLMKSLTGVPCPSCGITRAVLLLFQGDLSAALYLNPFGIILSGVLLISPLWLGYDLVFNKESLFSSYKRCEANINKKWVALPLGLLVLVNWLWNIYKGI